MNTCDLGFSDYAVQAAIAFLQFAGIVCFGVIIIRALVTAFRDWLG